MICRRALVPAIAPQDVSGFAESTTPLCGGRESQILSVGFLGERWEKARNLHSLLHIRTKTHKMYLYYNYLLQTTSDSKCRSLEECRFDSDHPHHRGPIDAIPRPCTQGTVVAFAVSTEFNSGKPNVRHAGKPDHKCSL
jgi:hypothetical protein